MKLKRRELDSMLNELERNLAMVRMIRHSSNKVRGKLSFKSVDSTWKVSKPTGQFLQSLIFNYNENERNRK